MLKKTLIISSASMLGVAVLMTVVPALAQTSTIIVNATSDREDFGGAQQIGDLPGPDGRVTLREAITAANNTPGPQTIAFNIPTSDPGFGAFGFAGQFVIMVEGDPLFV